MIKLHLTANVRPVGWTWTGTCWTNGESSIEPFSNPALEQAVAVRADGAAGCVIVRERRTGEPPLPTGGPGPILLDADRYDRLIARAAAWDLSWTVVEIGHGSARVRVGRTGVGPVYVTVAPDGLHGSWDLLDLRPYINIADLNAAEVVRWVSYLGHYSRSTIFRAVGKVTERATATWTTQTGVTVSYPEPAPHAKPRVLRPGADPVGYFADLLDRVTAHRPLHPGELAVELSGGLDSANVAASLTSTLDAPVATVALIVEGAAGEQQRRRRKELLDRLALTPDAELPLADAYPFHLRGPRRNGAVFSPTDGTYAEATAQIYAHLAQAGVRCVATGIGGDEAMCLTEAERQATGTTWPTRPVPDYLGGRCAPLVSWLEADAAPAPVLTFSTLLGLACRSPEVMRHGLWPVSPLAAPEVLRLCESLPIEWRLRKRLLRERLARLGLSDDVLYPALNEQFGPTIEAAMRSDGIPLLRRYLQEGALLTEYGYLDRGRLLAACDRAEATGGAESLYRPLMLEIALRSMQ